jgi:hypothetical protein
VTATLTAAIALPANAPAAPVRSRRWRPSRALLWALAGSLLLHVAFTLWPVDDEEVPDAIPLQATITELPPPPTTAAPAPAPKPLRKPRRADAPPPPLATAEPAPATETAAEPAADERAAGEAAVVADAAPAFAEAVAPDAPPPPAKVLPPRVDLAYKVYFGTRGFLIGEATYRFEHADNRYRISTVGEARGLAALLLRGQGKLESRGTITAAGLQPHEFVAERGSRDRRERATFDWESGIVSLHDDKTAALMLPTFDPLALMWQYYFSPPTADEQTVSIATTRRVVTYTVTRTGTETIAWPNGELDTEVWHRVSADGKTDALIWLAPKLNFIPVKIRVSNTDRGTLEVMLDAIRVDEPDREAVSTPVAVVTPADAAPASRSPMPMSAPMPSASASIELPPPAAPSPAHDAAPAAITP